MRFRRRPGTVEAWRWDGTREAAEAIKTLAGEDRIRIFHLANPPSLYVLSDRNQLIPVKPGERMRNSWRATSRTSER